MDSEAKAFETPFPSEIGQGTPLACYRPMPAQRLEVSTPLDLLASLVAFLAVTRMPSRLALLPAPIPLRPDSRA